MIDNYVKVALIIFIVIVIVTIIILVSRKTLKQKQPNKQQSLKQGLGFYSDPTFTRCQNSDGDSNCNRPATQKVIYNCIPHPVTQKGCIDKNGDLSYNPKVTEVSCNLPCVESKLVEEDKIQLKLVNSIGICASTGQVFSDPQYQSTGSGCNKIVNKYTGLDYSDFFLGKFNPENGKYKLETCIPSEEYVGYSTTTVTCTPNEGIDGNNNCQVSCGEKNTLNYNGIFGSKLSSNALQYYPVEYDEDGVRRNVCYNLFGTNQVEVLNNNKYVPSNFYFPTKCYGIYNTQSNISFNNYYPIGNENVYQTNNFFANNTKYFLLNNENKDVSKIIDLNNFESIYQNYENYTFVKVGEETTLLGNLYTNNINNVVNTSTNSIENYFGNGYFKYTNSVIINFDNGSDDDSSIAFSNSKTYENQNFYLAEPFGNIFENSTTPYLCTYYIENNKTYININNIVSVPSNVYGLYYITQNNYQNNNNGNVVEIESYDSNTIVLDHPVSNFESNGKLFIYLAKEISSYSPHDGPAITNENFYNNFHITGNITMNEINGRKVNNALLIKSDNTLEDGTSYYYFGRKSLTRENLFYYPLYTTSGSDLQQISFSTIPNKIFYTSDTNGHNLGPSTLGAKDLNIEYGTVEILLKYPNSQSNISFFPIGFDVFSPGIKYNNSNNQYNSNFDSFTVNLKTETLNNYYFACLLRNNSNYIPQNNPLTYESVQEEKLYTYFDTIKNVENLNNTNGETVSIVFQPEKNYILEANYDVFLSPYSIEENGQINRLCYDENNRPLQRGIIKTLKTNSKIYHNYGCNNYNLEDGVSASCGQYVVDDNLKCFQQYQDNNPTYNDSCTGVNVKNTYFNNQGFLEEGMYDDKELKCNSKNCFPLKYTDEANSSLTNYQKNDEVYVNKQKKDYYLSLINNNNFDPLNVEYWSRIFPYNPGESVTVGQRFFIKPQDQDTIYVYECIEDGVAPYGLEDLSINFDYLKQQPIYTTFSNTGLGISSYGGGNPEGFASSLFQENLVIGEVQDTFLAYGLAYQYPFSNQYQLNLNSINNVSYNVFSRITNNLSIDVTLPENINAEVGDTYNPSFAFWNKFIIYMVSQRHGNLRNKFISGAINNKDLTSTQENITFVNSVYIPVLSDKTNFKLKQGDYAVLVPVNGEEPTNIKNFFGLNYPLIMGIHNVDTSKTSNKNYTVINNQTYLGEFELINVLEVISDTELKVKRNVLNTPEENILNANNMKNIDDGFAQSLVVYVPQEFFSLQYNLTSTNKFSINSTINSNIGISPGTFETSSGTCTIINNETFEQSYQNYYTQKIISNNIVYPSTNTNNGIYYVTNNNYANQLYNTITEIYYQDNNYYFNEYKVNSEDNNAFSTDDIISIKINDNNYQFKVVKINSYANNKFYDYKCVSITSDTNFKTDFQNKYNYKTNTNVSSSSYNLFVPSVISKKSSGNDTYFVYDTGVNNDNKLYLVDGNSTKTGPSFTLYSDFDNLSMEPYEYFRKYSGTSPNNYLNGNWKAQINSHIGFDGTNAASTSFLPTEGSSVSSNNSGFDYFCNYQYELDKGLLATFVLDETRFYSAKDSVGVTITKRRGKPAGPSYLKKLPNSNQILKDGYGHITGFELSKNSINQNLQSNYYQSQGGFVLFSTENRPAKFNIFSIRDNFKQFPIYNLDTYIEGNIVEYTNNNERIYYRNVEGNSNFDSRKWLQIPETVYPENNTVFELEDSSIYFPTETVSVNNNVYNVDKSTKGSDFPTNFSLVEKTGNLSSPLNDFYVIKDTSRQLNVESIKRFNLTNTNKYPLALKNTSTNKNFCPSQCTGTCVISYDNNSFVNKVYSNISPDFYNNTYIYSQQNINEDFWSLSNTPVAKGSNTYDVKFLEETNDPFNGNLYSQYVFNLATPENIQNGTVLCSGSCFSNIDNKIYSNSLLNFAVPLDLDSQDMVKYDVVSYTKSNLLEGKYITPSVSHINIPSCRTSFSAVVYDGNTYQEETISYGASSINYIETYQIFSNPGNNTLQLEGTTGNTINLKTTSDDYDYLPFGKISNHGTCYQFGDLWYIKNDTEVVSHGFLDPLPDGSLHQRSFIYIQKNSPSIDSDINYGLCFVTKYGQNFEVNGKLDYTNKYLLDYSLVDNSSFTNDTYTLKTVNNQAITPAPTLVLKLTDSFGICAANYGNQQYALMPDDLDVNKKIYQKTSKQDYIKTRLYSMFGKNYLSSLVYGPNNDVYSNQGNQYPGLIFKPYKGEILGTQDPSLELLAGKNVQSFENYQDVFLLNLDSNNQLNIKTNPYRYPINNTENYSFIIDGVAKPNIFNSQNIYQKDYAPLNIIETTEPSLLIGTSSSGISFVNSGTITELFNNTITSTNDNMNQEVARFSQIRENDTGLHYDSSSNCTLFFTEPKSITNFSISDQITFETDGSISPSAVVTNGITQQYNYGLNINQNNVKSSSNAAYFTTQSGTSITNSGTSPFMLGNKKLYIYYYLSSYSVTYDVYQDKKYFDPQSNKQVVLVCQSDLQTSEGTCTINFNYGNNTIPIQFTQ